MPRHSPVRSSLLLVFLATSAFAAGELSDVVSVPRPEKGEFMGLYLKNQKIGYMFSNVTLAADKKTVTAVTEIHFMAKVGQQVSDRTMKETRVYESKPGGKLLSFVMEQSGDGGEQRLEGTALPTGVRVVRKKPGLATDVKMLPAAKEVVEDADQGRVALKRNAKVEGVITDSTDLMQYKVVTTVGTPETRTVSGVQVKLKKVTTLSEKEKVPTDAYVDPAGRMVEVHFGPTMSAMLEPEDVAKRVDMVEVFSLTRVTMPRPAPPEAREVPGSFTLVLQNVPDRFWNKSYRQQWKKLDGGKVEVTVTAAAPKVLKPRPLIDPNGGANLKSTLAVEADNPDIIKLAKQIAGDEKDAWTVAKKVNQWVFKNLEKDYGSSSDAASDVLKLKKGDCTEHSLLEVALLRALHIPARRVDGLIYLMNDDHVPALYWHEWVEAYVGEWTQLDPTWGQDIAWAGRLGLGEENSSEITMLIGSMAVAEVR